MSDANNASTVNAKPVLTKEERIAKIDANIAALQVKRDDILNDRIPQAKPKKVVYVPEVGDKVLAPVGRNTATSQAKVFEGVVRGIKPAVTDAEGKTISAAQVRVEIGEGFDSQFVTLYPAQLTKVVEAAVEGDEPADSEQQG